MIPEDFSKELVPYLEKAMEAENADMALVQLFSPRTNTLTIAAQIGFEKEFLNHFKTVVAFDSSSYGRAAGVVSTVIISDVVHDVGYGSHRAIAKTAGYRAVKSVPFRGKNRQLLGVLSTHFKGAKWHWETDKLKDVLKELAKIVQEHEDVIKL